MELGEESEAQHPTRTARAMPLASVLAVAYLLVIAYASLRPFSGWRVPPDEIRQFLTAQWPPYITLQDVLLNIAAYVPLGFLLATALMTRYSHPRAVLIGVVLALLMSTIMEALQSLLPTRVASNVDILANTLGGLIGALAAPVFALTHRTGIRVARLRREWFAPGRTADVGVVVVSLWLLTQLHPTAQLFGTGRLRETLDLPVWFVHTPQALVVAQAAVAGLNFLGIGLIVVALTRDTMARVSVIGAVVGTAIAAKALAAVALMPSAGILTWLTPGVVVGLLAGGILLYALARLPRRAQWIAAALSFAAAIAAINVGPDNPYQTLPPQFLVQGPTHFLSFSGMVRALSELWPFLAVGYALVAAGARRPS